jgi:quercetin dioxygenase-like cupin family protein
MALASNEEETRRELMRPGNGAAFPLGNGILLREFVSEACGARGFSTGTATLDPRAVLLYHTHAFSEAITLLSGAAQVAVEGRCYELRPFDCLHVPAGVAHEVTNWSNDVPAVALWAFASAIPSRELINHNFVIRDRGLNNPQPGDPESIVRFANAQVYELSSGAHFRDLFAGRFGTVGVCGGYGKFQPGASLPCHVHQCDESITIIEGRATCLVQGNRYQLSGCDTAFVPEGLPHRFINQSEDPMAMIWVYASTEPERTLVEAAYCDGTLAWPGRPVAVESAGKDETA